MRPDLVFGTRPAPPPPEVVARLRRWVRTHLDLAEDDPVTVTQLACRGVSCAPIETVLAVLRPGAPLRRTFPLPAELVSVAHVQQAFTETAGASS